MCPVHDMDWARRPSFGSCARAKRRQRPPIAHALVREATGSTSSTAKQRSSVTHLEHGDRVVSPPRMGTVASHPICMRNTSSTSRSQMCARECTHPLRAIVRAGVQGWVLEQGEGSHNRGQQLVVHGDARRTVDSTYSRCCSLTLLSSAPPETHRLRTLVPPLRRTARRMSSERNTVRAGAPSAPFP